MNKVLLSDAAKSLASTAKRSIFAATGQAIRQFNALLARAKELYPSRPDILALEPHDEERRVDTDDFFDSADRLRAALELRQPGRLGESVEAITLPPDAVGQLERDLEEFKEAVALGLQKTALLLAGALAEALLLLRHSDTSDRGPGLAQLVKQARTERLFGRDILTLLDTLTDYRDLIHTRAGPRNRITLSDTRIEHAVMAVKQVCSELQDTTLRFA